jgi:hypothetical protein
VTSKITSAVWLLFGPTYVTLSLPPVPRPVVTPFARSSLPAGKLSVEVVGLLFGESVSEK